MCWNSLVHILGQFCSKGRGFHRENRSPKYFETDTFWHFGTLDMTCMGINLSVGRGERERQVAQHQHIERMGGGVNPPPTWSSMNKYDLPLIDLTLVSLWLKS